VTRDALVELAGDPDLLFADGFDDAMIGVVRRSGQPPVVVYDRDVCITVLMTQGMTRDEAEEHFAFNTEGAWVGDRTPAFLVRAEEW
jgi:hypothetical protein